MNLQKINVKLFTDAPERVPLDPFLDIFSRWREDRSHPAGWIDLADYAHVARGPGIVLIGTHGNLSVDLADPGPGFLYASKQGLEGTCEERIREAFRRTLALVTALRREPGFPGALEPRAGFWEISVNDRLGFPNTEETDRLLGPAVRAVAAQLFGSDAYQLIRQAERERRYGFTLHGEEVADLDQIAEVLGNTVSGSP